VQGLITDKELTMVAYIDKRQRDADRAVLAAQQLIAVHKASVSETRTAHKQEMVMLRLLLTKLEADAVSASTIAVIDKKSQDLLNAPRDEYGSAMSDGPDVHLVEFLEHAGVDAGVLNKAVSNASEHVAARAAKSGGQNSRNKDGSVPFKVGNIISHLGGIEGTSDAMESFVAAHAQKQADALSEAGAKSDAAAAKLLESNVALPQRLIDTKAKVAAPPGKNKVGECREYAKARLQQAKLLKDDATARRIQLMLKKNGSELACLVAELAHPVQPMAANAMP